MTLQKWRRMGIPAVKIKSCHPLALHKKKCISNKLKKRNRIDHRSPENLLSNIRTLRFNQQLSRLIRSLLGLFMYPSCCQWPTKSPVSPIAFFITSPLQNMPHDLDQMSRQISTNFIETFGTESNPYFLPTI